MRALAYGYPSPWAGEEEGREMTNLRHYDNLGTARFVTISCRRSLSLLNDPHNARAVLHQLASLRRTYDVQVFGYVIMPNHAHFVMLPPEGSKLGNLVGILKSLSGRQISLNLQKLNSPFLPSLHITNNGEPKYAIWRPRCYDHNCRTLEAAIEKINYCHENPVKRGLVKEMADWPWSSYRHYLVAGTIPVSLNLLSE